MFPTFPFLITLRSGHYSVPSLVNNDNICICTQQPHLYHRPTVHVRPKVQVQECFSPLLFPSSLVPPLSCFSPLSFLPSFVPPLSCYSPLLFLPSLVPLLSCSSPLLFLPSLVPSPYLSDFLFSVSQWSIHISLISLDWTCVNFWSLQHSNTWTLIMTSPSSYLNLMIPYFLDYTLLFCKFMYNSKFLLEYYYLEFLVI